MGGAHDNTKPGLRRELGGRLRRRDAAEIARRSRDVCAHLVSSAVFAATRHLVVYASRPWEVDPADVVREARHRGRPTYYPRVDGEDLRFHRAVPEELVPGSFGIAEPSPEAPPLDGSADHVTILVPGLAFDRAGTRLGSGRGFYDRALRRTPGATKIGLGFREEILVRLPCDPWDVAMDLVATEDGLFAAGADVGAGDT